MEKGAACACRRREEYRSKKRQPATAPKIYASNRRRRLPNTPPPDTCAARQRPDRRHAPNALRDAPHERCRAKPQRKPRPTAQVLMLSSKTPECRLFADAIDALVASHARSPPRRAENTTDARRATSLHFAPPHAARVRAAPPVRQMPATTRRHAIKIRTHAAAHRRQTHAAAPHGVRRDARAASQRRQLRVATGDAARHALTFSTHAASKTRDTTYRMPRTHTKMMSVTRPRALRAQPRTRMFMRTRSSPRTR